MTRVARGFSLIEVLVSLVVICIGIFALVALQARSLVLTQDSVQRNNAMMLAGDLLELMRSNRGAALSQDLFAATSPYAKAPGQDFTRVALTAADESCAKRPRGNGGAEVAGKDLTCWLSQVQALLPVSPELLKAHFAVCPTLASPGTATPPYSVCGSDRSSVVMIVLAWQDASSNTQGCAGGVCFYTLRAEL